MKFEAGAELSTKVSASDGELFTLAQDSHTTCGNNFTYLFIVQMDGSKNTFFFKDYFFFCIS